ncbi:MAG: hypothetical protein KAJ19_02670, partial [Gammaproteobacteria bacterium]|nr:hypothetical protein [Gammaproteobacteria bacterium]
LKGRPGVILWKAGHPEEGRKFPERKATGHPAWVFLVFVRLHDPGLFSTMLCFSGAERSFSLFQAGTWGY